MAPKTKVLQVIGSAELVQTSTSGDLAIVVEPQLGRGSGANAWFFGADARATFSVPAPGAFSDVGRNAFIGPPAFNMNVIT